jgi:hypothetical protein
VIVVPLVNRQSVTTWPLLGVVVQPVAVERPDGMPVAPTPVLTGFG